MNSKNIPVPKVHAIGGSNPEIMLKHESIRLGWRIEPVVNDTYRLSFGGHDHVLILHIPAHRAEKEINCIYSQLTEPRNIVGSRSLGDKASNAEIAAAVDALMESVLSVQPVPA
jgi:hypothetical protein